jgi:hypothetical protein
MNNQFESTYALLMRSEEKARSILEVLLYTAFILSAVAGIWQLVHTPVNITAPGLERCASCQISDTQIPARS